MNLHEELRKSIILKNPKSLAKAVALAACLWAGAVSQTQAQTIVFSDDFDGAPGNTVTTAGTNNGYKIVFSAAAGVSDFAATFGYDYSVNGIPPAPATTNGTTKGLRLNVNRDANPQISAVNLYPTNRSFSGNFSLKFDVYLSWVTINGTTEHALFGINHSANYTNRVSQVGSDGIFMAMDGDGGSSATSTTLRDYSLFRGAPAAIPTLILSNTAAFPFGPTPYLGGRFSAADAGFQGLFPGSTPVGTVGNQWVSVEVRQETNVVTWSLNNTVVVQFTNNTAYGSGDIMIGYDDAFASIGSNATFVVFDNISVTSLGGLPVATVTASAPSVTEGGASAQYTISRSDTSGSITVNYLLSGTASNGLDYTTLPGSVTFAPGAASTNITLTPLSDLISEPTETAILTLTGGSGYTVSSPSSATIAIIDTNTPVVTIGVTQPILLEGVSNAVVPMTLTRVGATNVALSVNLGYSGTATRGADYNAAAAVSIAAGATTATFNMTPINDDIVEGNESAIVSVASGSGYLPGAASSITNTIVDDDVLPGVAFFADSFNTVDSSTNWVVNFSDGGADTYANFGYDYSVDGIPEAPSTPPGAVARHGLKMHVNEANISIAGISASPANGDYEDKYRMRFDMYLMYAGPLNNPNVPGQTQAGTSGVGATGVEPVWLAGGQSVGTWMSFNADGGSGAVSGDYNAYNIGTLFADDSGVYAAGTTNGPRDNFNVYYAPWPATTAPASVTNAHPTQTGTTPVGTFAQAWHKVAVTKRGAVVTWDIDGRRISTVDTAAFSIPLSTNVFIGYQDPFSSVTTNASSQFGLFDNFRVETLGRPNLATTTKVGSTVTIAFMGEAGDANTDFQVLSATTVTGVYAPVAATITQVDATHFTATVTSAAPSTYFKVQRL